VQLYSNCAGNPDCDCQNDLFNNMVGINGFSNATGEIQTLTLPGVQVQTTIPTVQVSAPTTAPTSTTSTSGSTLNKVLDIGSSVLGLFGSKATTPTYTPTVVEENKIPMAVWVVVGGLLLLVVAFVIVKQAKK
jgi:hypothetical protein